MVIWRRVLDCLDCPDSASQVTHLIGRWLLSQFYNHNVGGIFLDIYKYCVDKWFGYSSVLSCFPLQKIDIKADPQQTLWSILLRIVDRSVFVTLNKSVVMERVSLFQGNIRRQNHQNLCYASHDMQNCQIQGSSAFQKVLEIRYWIQSFWPMLHIIQFVIAL